MQSIDISKTELEVMQVIWQTSPCNAQQIIEHLNKQKPWHDKTVKTLLGRLVKKGAISFNKHQRSYQYFPLIEQQDYQIKESVSLMERLFGGKVSPLVASFASSNKLGKDDVEQLKKFIADWEQEND